MDRGAWWATVHGVAKSWTRLSDFTFIFTFMHWRRQWHPLQCSCLENPRDGGAWWAAVYGVTQSRTRLKRLSSSSSSNIFEKSVSSLRLLFPPHSTHTQTGELLLIHRLPLRTGMTLCPNYLATLSSSRPQAPWGQEPCLFNLYSL